MITKGKLTETWQETGRFCREKKKWLIAAGIGLIVLLTGYFIFSSRHTYTAVSVVKEYEKSGADNYSYAGFADGVIRYSRDGVMYLDQDGQELWNQPAQLQNPKLTEGKESFVIADGGGNAVMIFDEKGLKGEFSTVLPIERAAVSKQGIVAAILKNDTTPKVVVYDTAGNVLAEIQTTVQKTGYPVALALSDDANLLGVSYLTTEGSAVKTRMVYYNFGTVGQGKKDNLVTQDEYEGTVAPVVFFSGNDTAVMIRDAGFTVYEGKQVPEATVKITLDKEIKSTFHSAECVGFVLRNTGKRGYELRVYNLKGKQVMSADFQGDYGSVKLAGDEIIMLEGTRGCIYTLHGTVRFKGDLEMDTAEMIPVNGRHRYLLLSSGLMRKVRLVK